MNSRQMNPKSFERSSTLLRAPCTTLLTRRQCSCLLMPKMPRSFALGRYLLYSLQLNPRKQKNLLSAASAAHSQVLYIQAQHPSILEHFDDFTSLLHGKRLAVFLDYDGTCF